MTVFREFKDALQGLWSLVVGLKITGHQFTKKQVTVHYPRQAVDNLSTFRGHIELVGKPKQPAEPKCISCMMCASVCPSGCLTVKKFPKPKPPKVEEGQEPPKPPKPIKTPKAFTYNYNLCSLCGLCVQSCPVNSLRFSTDVYLAGSSREAFEYDLIARLKEQAAGIAAAKADPAQPAPESAGELSGVAKAPKAAKAAKAPEAEAKTEKIAAKAVTGKPGAEET